jgi:hypothetical protein
MARKEDAMNKVLMVRCPVCSKNVPWEGNPQRPFCSERCRQRDLGRWADEDYRIQGEKVDPETLQNVVEFPHKS